jgi:hypothetical protein
MNDMLKLIALCAAFALPAASFAQVTTDQISVAKQHSSPIVWADDDKDEDKDKKKK